LQGERRPTSFAALTYNLLAKSLVDVNDPDFVAIPPDVLDWPQRSVRLQNQLRSFNPDLACLQELDSDCVDDFLRPFARDFDWKHKSRTGDNRDGCALLWKPAVFELIDYRAIEFKNMPGADGKTPLDFMDRDNVAQVAALRHRATGRVVVVANCHLLFNRNRGDIKLAQVVGLLRVVALFKRTFTTEGAPEPAVFIGGDFNSTPISGVYALMANGVLDTRDIDMRLVSGQQRRVFKGGVLQPTTGHRKTKEMRSIAEISVHCFGAAPIVPLADDASAAVEPADKKPKVGANDDDNDNDINDNDNATDVDGASRLRRTRSHNSDDENDDDEPDADANTSESIVLHHTLGLASAYPRASETSRHSATCMRKYRFDQHWVDHIFTSSQLRVLSVLAVPRNCRDKISPFGLPTRAHPSDHLPLCAIVEFAGTNEKQNK
jgi:mRNA deadenylase 3'-5' endonuclease subunit Ccr4